MKAIIPVFTDSSMRSLYLQLYDYIKQAILHQEIAPGEKLPSLRNLSSSLELSLTTVENAYNQLAVEGYVENRPRSGYYVSELYDPGHLIPPSPANAPSQKLAPPTETAPPPDTENPSFRYDLSCFNFVKWKKCLSSVLSDTPEALLTEGSARGETALRREIVKYLYASRGVSCQAEQVVIAAGTQQITALLSTILLQEGISHVAVEDPGYLPVHQIFRDRGFNLSAAPVQFDGVDITKLPTNLRCAAYVNPSNQFPTGAVMPAGKRYRLLHWAADNDSYIIEDDYDSELRYFGQPIPAMKSLDHADRVIYLGSFSSTLFAAVKISYMVLPPGLTRVFDALADDYSQTCSKMEQLALALFMQRGYYRTGIKKMRRRYADKLQRLIKLLEEDPSISVASAKSGINLLMNVHSKKPAAQLCREAGILGLRILPVREYTEEAGRTTLIFYYNQIPLEEMEDAVKELLSAWRS